MSKANKRMTEAERFVALDAAFQQLLPAFYGVLCDEENFTSFLVKAKPDGTVISVVKQFGGDGGPMVVFGTGYGAIGALMGVEASIRADAWRPDTPWKGSGK